MPLEIKFRKSGREIREAVANRIEQLRSRLEHRSAGLEKLRKSLVSLGAAPLPNARPVSRIWTFPPALTILNVSVRTVPSESFCPFTLNREPIKPDPDHVPNEKYLVE
jgi:hypothetical protein